MFYVLTCKTIKGEWTRAHTDMLNDIAAKICNRMQLGLIDMSRGVRTHVGCKVWIRVLMFLVL